MESTNVCTNAITSKKKIPIRAAALALLKPACIDPGLTRTASVESPSQSSYEYCDELQEQAEILVVEEDT